MRKINLNTLLAVCILMIALVVPASAVTHYVSPGQSIQAAIDASSNGDEIEAAPGMYNEAIDFKGKAVRLYSSGGPEVTTMDATGLSFSVVSCTSGEGPNTILAGFTITGGTGSPDGYEKLCGGGMRNEGSSPTVTNCTFSGNSAYYGGGMNNHNHSSPTVTNCTFSGNSAYSTSTDMPGGGGGMCNILYSSPTVTNCMFVGNIALNLVQHIYSYGGGMNNVYKSTPTMTNCTFSNNKAYYGAGLSNYGECVAIVKNCIFWQDKSILYPISWEIFNHPPTGCYQEPGYIAYSTAIVSYSDIEDGEIVGFGLDMGGNIDADPNFIDPGYWDANGTPEDLTDDIWINGDYHLSASSPCIDSGSNCEADIDKVDLDGDGITNEPVPLDMDGYPRFTDDPNTPDLGVYFASELAIVDMGAYEYPGRGPVKGDTNGDGVVNFKDLAILCNNWLAGTEPKL